MTKVTTELVVYEDGVRKVIGTAEVSADGKEMTVEGMVTDETYQAIFSQSSLSVFLKPSSRQPERSEVVEARLILPLSFRANVALPPHVHFAKDAVINSPSEKKE